MNVSAKCYGFYVTFVVTYEWAFLSATMYEICVFVNSGISALGELCFFDTIQKAGVPGIHSAVVVVACTYEMWECSWCRPFGFLKSMYARATKSVYEMRMLVRRQG